MTAIVQRFFTAGILVIWATVLCFLYFSGRITAYLHPTFQPYAMACGLVLGVLALLVLLAPEEAAVGSAGCEPGKPRSTLGSLVVAFILVMPLLVTLAFTRDGFSASTILNRGYVETAGQLAGAPRVEPAPASVEPALPGESEAAAEPADAGAAEDTPPPEIIDLLYAAQIPDMRSGIDGRTFDFVGQFMPVIEMNGPSKRFRIVRLMMLCCAADAQPISVQVEMPNIPDIKEMTWVKVRGKVSFPTVGDTVTPLITAESVTRSDPPEDPYLY